MTSRETEFQAALDALSEYVNTPIQEDRDLLGNVAMFNLCLELAWRLLQDRAKAEGYEQKGPRASVAIALQQRWIPPEEAELWSRMFADRNLTTHTYKRLYSSAIMPRIADEYLPALVRLRDRLLESSTP